MDSVCIIRELAGYASLPHVLELSRKGKSARFTSISHFVEPSPFLNVFAMPKAQAIVVHAFRRDGALSLTKQGVLTPLPSRWVQPAQNLRSLQIDIQSFAASTSYGDLRVCRLGAKFECSIALEPGQERQFILPFPFCSAWTSPTFHRNRKSRPQLLVNLWTVA